MAPVVCYGLRISQLQLALQNYTIVRPAFETAGHLIFSPKTLIQREAIFALRLSVDVDCSLHNWLVVVWGPDAVGWWDRNPCLLGQWAVTLITLVTSVNLVTKSVTLVTLTS